MAFEIVFSESAMRDIAKLDTAIKKRLSNKLEQVANLDLLTMATKPLSGDLAGFHRIRLGDYRVVVCVEDKIIEVLRVRHRRNAYHK